MKATFQSIKISVLIVALLACCLYSCKTNIPTDTPLGNAHLLVVNGAPGSPTINFYWTGNKLNTIPLAYGNTTGYRNLTSGLREVQIKSSLTNKLLAASTIKVKQDSSYSFFIFEANNAVASVIGLDDLSAPSVGNAKIRLVNLSAGLSSADLLITNGPELTSSISFGSIGTYQELKAGTYNFDLRLHGTKNILLTIPNVRLDNTKTYTIWSSGAVGVNGKSTLSTQIISQ